MSIHSENDEVILQFGLKKPAFRIVVNTPTTHGSIGLTTGLDPAMTLGCGGWGGNITSDNISPRHLLNIKRVAYELRPAQRASTVTTTASALSSTVRDLPRAPGSPAPLGLDAASMVRQMESAYGRPASTPAADSQAVVDFVCEEDVRQAIRLSRKIVIGERTIVTPAARDLADAHRVLVTAAWPRE
jgi:acetaldehyde dehydrogenase (acetylating)